MKILHCQDAGFNCTAVIKAESEEEILQQAARHAAMVHHVEVTPAMAAQIRTLIKDDNNSDPEAEAEKGHS
jgi:predicted small metal-binding protein